MPGFYMSFHLVNVVICILSVDLPFSNTTIVLADILETLQDSGLSSSGGFT